MAGFSWAALASGLSAAAAVGGVALGVKQRKDTKAATNKAERNAEAAAAMEANIRNEEPSIQLGTKDASRRKDRSVLPNVAPTGVGGL